MHNSHDFQSYIAYWSHLFHGLHARHIHYVYLDRFTVPIISSSQTSAHIYWSRQLRVFRCLTSLVLDHACSSITNLIRPEIRWISNFIKAERPFLFNPQLNVIQTQIMESGYWVLDASSLWFQVMQLLELKWIRIWAYNNGIWLHHFFCTEIL